VGLLTISLGGAVPMLALWSSPGTIAEFTERRSTCVDEMLATRTFAAFRIPEECPAQQPSPVNSGLA